MFCPNTVRYIIDFSLSIASPRPEAKTQKTLRGAMTKAAKG
jgi:hypothetical protein